MKNKLSNFFSSSNLVYFSHYQIIFTLWHVSIVKQCETAGWLVFRVILASSTQVNQLKELHQQSLKNIFYCYSEGGYLLFSAIFTAID